MSDETNCHIENNDVRFIYGVIPVGMDWFNRKDRQANPWKYPDPNPIPKLDFTPVVTDLRNAAAKGLVRLADLVDDASDDVVDWLDGLARKVRP